MYHENNVLDSDIKTNDIPENQASDFIMSCFEWIEAIAEAIIPVVIILAFVFRIVNVDGDSMLNTLHDKDKIVVAEWYYKPKNGDVVVIRRGQYLDEPIVKRVIATEGQTLSIDFNSGSVTVNGKVLSETYIKEKMWLREDGDIPSVIPQGYCFVMGDNRNDSLDSRSKAVGLIKNNDVKGRVSFIIFPFNRIGSVN